MPFRWSVGDAAWSVGVADRLVAARTLEEGDAALIGNDP